MKKRIVSLLLAAIMAFTLLPITAFASETSYDIINGSPLKDKDKNGGYITLDEAAAKGDTVEVTVVPNSGYKLKSLKYAPASKTVADILPEDFPAAESDVSGAPGSAWKSATLDQLCYISHDGTKLYFYKEAGEPDKCFDINTNESLSVDKDGNYVYTDRDAVTITFSMAGEGGALNLITFTNTAIETWDGTYQGAACVAAGTMVTMYNGEQKAIEDLEIGDTIRTFDHVKGEVSSADVCFIWESKHAANAFSLTFDGGIKVTVIEEHGFYDYKENKYVFINAGNAKDFIGHQFYNADTEGWLELKDVEILNTCIDAYAIATSKHLNHLSNGMLSICDGTFEKIANLFEYDSKMKYDAVLMEKDIEKYGLTSLEDVLKYKGFNEADYYDYNLQYLDIALGKGFVSSEWIEALSEYCAANNIYDSMPVSKAPKMLLMSAPVKDAIPIAAPKPETENDTEITPDANGKYIFTMPAYDVTVTAEFELTLPVPDPEYVILTGENSKWTKGAKDGVTVTCSGAYDELSAVYMDGKPIDKNSFDLFPAALAIADDEANISRSLEGRAAGVSVIANIGIGEPVQLVWSPILIEDGGADFRITDPDRVIMFRVPWVDDQANNIGTPGDRGRQLAIISDDYSLSVIPLGGYKAFGKENITPALGRMLLIAGFPKEDTLSDYAVIKIRGLAVSGDISTLHVVDGVPSGEVPEATTPGGGATIRIRGGSSLSASNDPLIVIDGMVMGGGSFFNASNSPLIIVDGMVMDGAPSGGSTVRIRGVGAFNNDPLIVVDGTPAQSGFHTLTSDEYKPYLKSRGAITQDGISILLRAEILPEEMSNGEGIVIDVSAFTGIELKPEYLETLSVGKHTLTFEYKDGKTVSTEIEIIAANPETGDNMTALWISLCAAAMLCGAVIIKKKAK